MWSYQIGVCLSIGMTNMLSNLRTFPECRAELTPCADCYPTAVPAQLRSEVRLTIVPMISSERAGLDSATARASTKAPTNWVTSSMAR